MKLNFKGFFKAAGLCSLAFALTGCITAGLVFNTASPPHAEQWRSDTLKGLSLAEDSNGTKGYVFVGESLDYLLTTGGGEVVKMLNDPAIHGERITVSDNAKFILSSSNKNFSGAITLYYHWNNEEDKALATRSTRAKTVWSPPSPSALTARWSMRWKAPSLWAARSSSGSGTGCT